MSTFFVCLAEGIRRTWPLRVSRSVTADRDVPANSSPARGDGPHRDDP
jgi:hypothetical protein